MFLVVAGWLAVSIVIATRLTGRFQPPLAEPTPTISWGTITSFRLPTSDHQELGAWYIDAASDRPVVLLLHGNNTCRTSCLKEAEILAAAKYAVLMITHRAHGDSTGDRNDFGFSARHDVLAAVDWLKCNHPNRPIIVWGKSLGSAAALFAAGDLNENVKAYILECPYRDLRTAVRNRTSTHLFRGLDRIASFGLETVAPIVLPNVDEIAPINAAATVPASIPVLILAGGGDTRAKPEEAKEIHERMKSHSELVVIENADHLQLAEVDPKRYRELILEFLQRTLGR